MDRDIPMSIKMGPKSFKEIKDLDEGKQIDEAGLLELLKFIDYRLDCADFRMVTVLRTLYSYSSLLTDNTIQEMRNTILSFKYWMDEPGDDSMCYWSENHQLLFFTCGYVAGRYYQNELFTNSYLTGAQLSEKFRGKIFIWLKHRFEHGFIEWHSNTYYEEDIAPLALLIDFGDEEIKNKAAIIMDLILADMAMHLYKGLFSVTSGRCYEVQKREPLTQDVLEINEFLFGNRYKQELDYTRISANLFLCKNYELPKVIFEIANDKEPGVIKTSMGHDLDELEQLRAEKGEVTAGYIQWAMESFTNLQSIRETMRMFRAYNMKANDFLKDLKMLDIKSFSFLLPLVTKMLNPVSNGVAIQKVNSYTYRKANYILSTAQNYYPGTFGDQHHIWQATLNKDISIFSTHPGAPIFDDNARNFSPSYWVGNGIQPHSAQFENVHLSIYKVDQRKGFMERHRIEFTHAHFPIDRFEQAHIEGKYAFGTKECVHVALIGGSDLVVNPNDRYDLIQHGKTTYWIFEVSDSGESYEQFQKRIKQTNIHFEKLTLKYGKYKLKYKDGLYVDGKRMEDQYKRLESPYGNFDRGANEIELKCKGHRLTLNFDLGLREQR
ncbi:hypothetical protein [Bacillus sp. 7884-1]|uniref:hypothetical protein n=1 Tax=Bacillus sp. 7884-1 TaxID=2021693 RepID=UPI000BA66831|nr:hypothetical protein [Bacillus sp. 7884-1]PAE38037.1 hypothetical protein CHI06_19220 [Bacillus sp. 7884-1]